MKTQILELTNAEAFMLQLSFFKTVKRLEQNFEERYTEKSFLRKSAKEELKDAKKLLKKIEALEISS